jgi:polar amino acid transport system substrate-binding protein
LLPVTSYEAAKDLLDQGSADAFAADAATLSGWVQEFPEYRLLAPLISVEPLCIVLPKGLKHDELRRRINTLLETWHADGWLKDRAIYWGLPWQQELDLAKPKDRAKA